MQYGEAEHACGCEGESDGPGVVSQAEGLAQTVAALDLKPEHAALRVYCEGLAAAIDGQPDRASLWREYRPALEMLIAVGEVAQDDGEAALLSIVSTPVGDAPKAGTTKSRSGGRGGGKAVGSAVDAVAGTGGGRRPRAAS